MIKEKVKKIGDVWVTKETLEKTFPKSCVVSCSVMEMKIVKDFPILLRQKSVVHYEVFGKDRDAYNSVFQKIKGVRHEKNS